MGERNPRNPLGIVRKVQLLTLSLLFIAVSGNTFAGKVSKYAIPKLKGDYAFDLKQAANPDGRMKKIKPEVSWVSAGVELLWKVSGIKDGEYYLQCLRSVEAPYGLSLNGEAVKLANSTEPVPYKNALIAICQTEQPLAIKNGDLIRWQCSKQNWLGGVALAKKKLQTPIKLWDGNTFKELLCELSGKFNLDEKNSKAKFTFDVKNISGEKDSFDVDCRITDYFQNEIVSFSKSGISIENLKNFSNEIPFSSGKSDRYKAVISVKNSIGEQKELTKDTLSNKLEGFRKKIWMNKGWKWMSIADDKTYESRIIRTPKEFTGKEKWAKTEIPFHWKPHGGKYKDHHVAWVKKKFVVPEKFFNKRAFIHVARAASEAKIFLNGKEIGYHLSPVAAFEFEITDTLKAGENEIMIGLRDNLALVDQLELKKKEPTLKKWSPGARGGLGEIYLYSTDKTPLEDIFVKTSFRKKNVELEITVPKDLPEGEYTLSNKILLKSKLELKFDDLSFNTKKGQKLFKIKKAWENPVLWGPEKFPLLQLTSELKDKKGTVLDEMNTRFGFREFYPEGRSLVWNGTVVKFGSRPFVNPWGWNLNSSNRRYNMRKNLQTVKKNECRMLRHIYGCEDFADVADEEGLVYAQGAMGVSGLSEKIVSYDKYWDSIYKFDRDMILGMRNHPCIVTWYLTNECYGESEKKNGERLKTLGEKILKVDDTRIIEFGCDLDLRGFNSIISTHYPAEKDALRKPSAFFPEAAYWRYFNENFHPGMKVPAGMCKNVANVYAKSPITWGYKPIIVNETCWIVFFNAPDALSKIYSDAVYASPGAVSKAHDLANTWFSRGHRDAEVSAITLWKWIYGNPNWISLPRYDINILEKYNKFYSGEKVTYNLNLTRDLFNEAKILYRWELKNGDDIVDSDEKSLVFKPSEMKREIIELKMPQVCKTEGLVLNVTLTDEKSSKVMRKEEFQIYVHPTASSPGMFSWLFSSSDGDLKYKKINSALKITVLDKSGETFKVLETLFEKPKQLSDLTAKNLAGTDLLIICENEKVSDKSGEIIKDFVEKGGKVLLMSQKSDPKWLPSKPLVSDRISSINYSFRSKHPLMKGITKDDLNYWYPKHKVIEKAYLKPSSGNFRVIMEAGGMRGMLYAGIMELPIGKGNIICSQLRLTEDLDKNPVPLKFWKNLLSYCESQQKALESTGFIGSKTGKLGLTLDKHGVDLKNISADKAKDFSSVILDADSKLSDESINDLRGFVNNGGTLFIQNTSPESIEQTSKICGGGVNIYPMEFRKWKGRAIRLGESEVTAGLTNYDIFWKARPESQNYRPCFTSPKMAMDNLGDWIIKSEKGESLIFPSFLVDVKLGKGKTILSNLNIGSSKPETVANAGRIMSTIFTNIGIKINEKVVKTINVDDMNYKPIDISAYLNRGFTDDIPADGKGGWTDQGADLDLRTFPLEKTMVEFNEIPFKIGKPNTCLVLQSKYRPKSNLELKVNFPVNSKADTLAFLQSSAWTAKGLHGTYTVNYDDGSEYVIKLQGGVNLRDWAASEPEKPFVFENDTITKRAWTGTSKKFGNASLYIMEWINPNPNKLIKSITMESQARAVLILVALSVGENKASTKVAVKSSPEQLKKAKEITEKAKAILAKTPNSKEAFKLLKKAVETAPDYLEASLNLGYVYEDKKDWPNAIAVYENLIINVPEQLEAYHRLGLCHEKTGNYKKAIKAYRASLKVNVNQPPIQKALEEAKKKAEKSGK